MKNPKPWKVVKNRCLVKNPWIKLFHKSFKLPNGKILKDYYTIEIKDGVAIITLNSKNQILLFKEFERGIMKPGYKLPGGSIDEKETPLEAAKRELLEETGYEASLTKIGTFDADPGLMSKKVTVFLAKNLTKFEPRRGEFEIFESEWLSISELKKHINSGEIQNIHVIASFYFLEAFLRSKK